jgi:biotin carboxyl carrier protein
MRLEFEYAGSPIQMEAKPEPEPAEDCWNVTLPDGSTRLVLVERLPGDILRILEGDRTFEIPFAVHDRVTEISYGGTSYQFTRATGGSAKTQRHTSGTLVAPMVGLVTDVPVIDGQHVAAYQPIAVIEAMKVLATIEAPFAGTVKLHVAKGHQVEHGALIAEVTPDTETAQ